MFNLLMDEDRPVATAYVDQVASSPIQQFAFNSAVSSASATGIISVLSLSQRPLAVLIMSPAMAKTLATSLLDRVKEYEHMTGCTVKSAFEVAAATTSD